MIVLSAIFAAHFDQIHGAYPSASLLELPVWKWAALVESWAFASSDPEKHDELERELRRDVDCRWAGMSTEQGVGALANPARWQENKAGESLLSVHRRRGG